MSKKRITAIILAVALIIAVAGKFVYSDFTRKKENSENLIQGVRLVAYEIGQFIETGNEEYFHQASVDLQSLEEIAENDERILSDDYRKEAFLSIINAFKYQEGELTDLAERLKAAFDLISEDKDEDYPYAQLYIVLDNIT